MTKVNIIVEGGDILENMNGIIRSTWPPVIHVQSFMGQESPVVIWLTSANYYDRQVMITEEKKVVQ